MLPHPQRRAGPPGPRPFLPALRGAGPVLGLPRLDLGAPGGGFPVDVLGDEAGSGCPPGLPGGAALARGPASAGRNPPPCAVCFPGRGVCPWSESPGEWQRGGGEGLHLLPGQDPGLAVGLDRGLPDRPDGQGQLVQGRSGLTTSRPA